MMEQERNGCLLWNSLEENEDMITLLQKTTTTTKKQKQKYVSFILTSAASTLVMAQPENRWSVDPIKRKSTQERNALESNLIGNESEYTSSSSWEDIEVATVNDSVDQVMENP